MENKITGIWLLGDTAVEGRWLEWYQDMVELFRLLGHKPTNIAVEFPGDKRIRELTVARKEKEILRRIEDGEMPTFMGVDVLPKPREYDDSTLFTNRSNKSCSKDLYFAINTTRCNPVDPEMIMEVLKKYSTLAYGEIFREITMDGAMMYMLNKETDVKLGRNTYRDTEILKIYRGEKYASRSE